MKNSNATEHGKIARDIEYLTQKIYWQEKELEMFKLFLRNEQAFNDLRVKNLEMLHYWELESIRREHREQLRKERKKNKAGWRQLFRAVFFMSENGGSDNEY